MHTNKKLIQADPDPDQYNLAGSGSAFYFPRFRTQILLLWLTFWSNNLTLPFWVGKQYNVKVRISRQNNGTKVQKCEILSNLFQSGHMLKGQCHEIVYLFCFMPLINWTKWFFLKIRFREDIRILNSKQFDSAHANNTRSRFFLSQPFKKF